MVGSCECEELCAAWRLGGKAAGSADSGHTLVHRGLMQRCGMCRSERIKVCVCLVCCVCSDERDLFDLAILASGGPSSSTAQCSYSQASKLSS